MVWLEDVKVPVTVALSMLDDIVPSEAIYNHFRYHYGEPDDHGCFKRPTAVQSPPPSGSGPSGKSRQSGLPDARVIAWNGIGHGGMLLSHEAQDRLILAMRSQAREQGLVRWVKRKGSL